MSHYPPAPDRQYRRPMALQWATHFLTSPSTSTGSIAALRRLADDTSALSRDKKGTFPGASLPAVALIGAVLKKGMSIIAELFFALPGSSSVTFSSFVSHSVQETNGISRTREKCVNMDAHEYGAGCWRFK